MAGKQKRGYQIPLEKDKNPAVYHGYYNARGGNVNTHGSQRDLNEVQSTTTPRSALSQDIHKMEYGVDDVPPWYFCFLLGFQHYLIMFGATYTNPMVVAPAICVSDDDNVTKSELIGTIFFVSGIVTLLQTTLGVRLPVVQGGTFTFVLPITALMSLERWACPGEQRVVTDRTLSIQVIQNVTQAIPMALVNRTMTAYSDDNSTDMVGVEEAPWKARMREIQGAIIVASLFQVLIGFTGLIGLMMRFIGPLVIAPTISLAGLALFNVAIAPASKQWWMALVTVVLIAAFSQYTRNLKIPCFTFEKDKGCHRANVAVFRLFPVIMAMGTTWFIWWILTLSLQEGSLPKANDGILRDAPWFRVPYPGQWGMPTVTLPAVFGMLAGVLASMVESIGDYYACARMAQVPPPPMHAVNRVRGSTVDVRVLHIKSVPALKEVIADKVEIQPPQLSSDVFSGIGMEGLGCVIAGAFGTGSGTTSYSENIGAIGITKVASRRVVQTSALIMITCGVVGKFGAVFVNIPEPIVGGVFIVMFGMIAAVGLSNLQFVDLNSSRNLFIIGFSFFFGLTLPKYINNNTGVIQTGNEAVDQIFTVLLSTSMFMGGFAAFVLDNTIPGTDEERGLIKWRQEIISSSKIRTRTRRQHEETESSSPYDSTIYEIPSWTNALRRYKVTRYIPFLPTFDDTLLIMASAKRKQIRREQIAEDNSGNQLDHVSTV